MVSLGPLERDDIVQLAGDAGLTLSPQTVDGVHALSSGNPFFAVQLLGHLADVPGHELGDGNLPSGVREWILERVDRLGDRARDALAPAAVVGRSFEVVLLADVLDVSPLEALTISTRRRRPAFSWPVTIRANSGSSTPSSGRRSNRACR